MDGINEISGTVKVKNKAGVVARSVGVSFGFPTFVPGVTNEYVNYAANFRLSTGAEFAAFETQTAFSGYVYWQDLKLEAKIRTGLWLCVFT